MNSIFKTWDLETLEQLLRAMIANEEQDTGTFDQAYYAYGNHPHVTKEQIDRMEDAINGCEEEEEEEQLY